MSSETLFASLSDYVNTNTLPPVENWHPDKQSCIDIRIDPSGNWIHEGGEIKRHSMVRVFSSILRKEGSKFYLVTPEVKLEIRVDDVPFLVTNMETSGAGKNRIVAFVTKAGDYLTLDSNHKLNIEDHGHGVKPYISVRQGMQGLLSRPVYYQLAEFCSEHGPDAQGKRYLGIWSSGMFFNLSDALGS